MASTKNNQAEYTEDITNFEFDVCFSMFRIRFSKITNLVAKEEYDTVYEGGNRNPIFLLKATRQPDTITFEKGRVASGKKEMFDLIRPGFPVSGIIIFVLHNGVVVKRLVIDEGIVVSKEYPTLDGLGNEIFIEKLQINHTGLREY